jgi:hypothetical protein
MNKIKVFIKAKIMQIPNYINRLYILNIKIHGLTANQGWMTSYKLRFHQIDDIEEAYKYLIDSDLKIADMRARYLEIMVRSQKTCIKP